MERIQSEAQQKVVELQPEKQEKQETVQEAPTIDGNYVNLEDVAFMVMVGRYKDGKPFFANVNVSDVFTVGGMLDYAQTELRYNYNEHIKNSRG
jgi:adenine deaminase